MKIDDIIGVPNILPLLDDQQKKTIEAEVNEGYETDKQSRAEWTERQANANKLALQVKEEKTFPWPNAASVKFPLITVAALQFHARAYPALISGVDLVKCRTIGEDPNGQKADRAKRISTHMSWQNLEQDENWEPEMDKLILVNGIAGCAFKKRLYEPGPGKQFTSLVLPDNLVINYYTKTLKESPRYTHTFYFTNNNIKQREIDKRFSPINETYGGNIEPDSNVGMNEITEAADERAGITVPAEDRVTPFFTGEQYCWYDLDGDGYQEPYIVTFDIGSGQLRRMVARFLPSGIRNAQGKPWQRGDKVYKVTPIDIFTHYEFIPSPDGGFYGLGLGSLLGPINETVNSTINQMLDAGTMAMLGGGFLGRGFRNKGGPISFQPNMWYPVDAPGDDLRKNILPLPVPQQSDILFKLLGFLVQYGERIVSSTDLQVGENIGQNTPAQTAQTMDTNGSRVYNGIYKRMWRAMRDEFRIQYDLNSIFLEVDVDYEDLTSGAGAMISPKDYHSGTPQDVRPAADPHIVSDVQAEKQATMMLQASQTMPGWNKYKTQLRWAKTMKIPNFEELLPPPQMPDPSGQKGPDGKPKMVPAPDYPPPPNPKLMDSQTKQMKVQIDAQKVQIDQGLKQKELQGKIIETQAKVALLYAQAKKALAEAHSTERDEELKLIELGIKAAEAHLTGLLEAHKIFSEQEKAKEGEQKPDIEGEAQEHVEPLSLPSPSTQNEGPVLDELKKISHTLSTATGAKVVTLPDGRKVTIEPVHSRTLQ